MFAPDGFVSFSMLQDVFDDLEDLFIEDDCVLATILSPVDDSDVENEFKEDFWQLIKMRSGLSEIRRQMAFGTAFRAWAIDTFMQNVTVFACSASGSKVIVDGKLFESVFKYSRYTWGREKIPSPRIQHLVSEFLYLEEFPEALCYEAFPFFDLTTGLICARAFPKLSEKYQRDIEFCLPVVAQLAGQSVCFREEDAPKDVDGLLKLIGVEFLEARSDAPKRMSNLAVVYEAMCEAYPDGKADSWTLVEKKVGYSRRHMERAMQKFDVDRSWACGGQ